MATRTSAATQIVLRPQNTNAIRRRSSGGTSRRQQVARKAIKHLRRRAANTTDDTKTALATVGVPVVLTLLEKKAGFSLPTLAGLHPHLLWGGLGVLFGKRVFGNTEMGRMVRAGSLGVAVSGATDATAAGSPMTTSKKAAAARSKFAAGKKKKQSTGDDEVGDDEVGDDEVGDDE